jgi:putative addiction module component (TIGR02574 family)
MSSLTNEVFSRALALPIKDRAALARRLLESLESEPPYADWETAWAEELDRRIAKVEAGNVETRDWREVIANIEKLEKRSETEVRKSCC